MNLLKLAYLNVTRRKSQSLLTGIITCITIMVFVLVYSVFSTIQSGLSLSNERLGADIIVLPNESSSDSMKILFTGDAENVYMPGGIEDKLKGFAGVEKTTVQFYTATIPGLGCCSFGDTLRLVGIDQGTDFILKPWFEQKGIKSLAPDEIIIGSNIEQIVGNQVSILGHKFKIAGTLYNTGSGMDSTIFMNIDMARKLAALKYSSDLWKGGTSGSMISSVLIKTKPGTNVELLEGQINSSGLGVKAAAASKSITTMKAQIGALSKVIVFLWLALLLISALALAGRFNSMARERKKEIGFLRAMGIHKSGIFKLIVGEAWIIAGIGGIIGSLLGVLMVKPSLELLSSAMVLPMGQWSLQQAVLYTVVGTAASLVLGLVASLYPAWRSSNMAPQEAISKGDLG